MILLNAVLEWNSAMQKMDGFGVCGGFHQGAHLETFYRGEKREELLNLLFSRENGLGISIVRNVVGDSGAWGNEIDGPTPSIEPEKGIFRFDGDDDQIWFMNEAKKRGCELFCSSVWSPPAWMKTNGMVNHGGSLKASCYQDFAEYLAAYVKGYKEHYGLDIFAISPANEPNLKIQYSSCLWSGDQFADFFKNYLGPVFKKQGIEALVVAPEPQMFGNAILERYEALFSDNDAMDAVDVVGLHIYEEESVIEPLKPEYIRGKPVWVTEFSELGDRYPVVDTGMISGLNVAEIVHDSLVTGNCTAFIYFWAVGSSSFANSTLVFLDLDLADYTVCKRAYTFGNFSRFIRPGFVRIPVTEHPQEGVSLSAYRGPDGELVIVGVNRMLADYELELELGSCPVQVLTPYRTSETENLACLKPLSAVDGKFRLTLQRQSVTSFAGCVK